MEPDLGCTSYNPQAILGNWSPLWGFSNKYWVKVSLLKENQMLSVVRRVFKCGRSSSACERSELYPEGREGKRGYPEMPTPCWQCPDSNTSLASFPDPGTHLLPQPMLTGVWFSIQHPQPHVTRLPANPQNRVMRVPLFICWKHSLLSLNTLTSLFMNGNHLFTVSLCPELFSIIHQDG